MKRKLLFMIINSVIIGIFIGCTQEQTQDESGQNDTISRDTAANSDTANEDTVPTDTTMNNGNGYQGMNIERPRFDSGKTSGNAPMDSADFCESLVQEDVFDAWDGNHNDVISIDEFSQSVFMLWDDNQNDIIDKDEWNRYSSAWFQGDNSFNRWDYNNNDNLSQKEFTRGIQEHAVIEAWNKETYGLNSDEFCAFAFSVWDIDNNGIIEMDEWDSRYPQWSERF